MKTPEEYLAQVAEDKKEAFVKLHNIIVDNIPKGFEETINYGMIGFVVPLSTFPEGYLNDNSTPLPFVKLAAQKNYISLYHSGIYADNDILEWFKSEYPKYSKRKLDMGKSCIRFKNMNNIPFELIAILMTKISVERWIELYLKNRKK